MVKIGYAIAKNEILSIIREFGISTKIWKTDPCKLQVTDIFRLKLKYFIKDCQTAIW